MLQNYIWATSVSYIYEAYYNTDRFIFYKNRKKTVVLNISETFHIRLPANCHCFATEQNVWSETSEHFSILVQLGLLD